MIPIRALPLLIILVAVIAWFLRDDIHKWLSEISYTEHEDTEENNKNNEDNK